jgi:hypothetical protein
MEKRASEAKEMRRARTIGVKRTVCVHSMNVWTVRKDVTVLTQVALDSVFAHTDERYENMTTLRIHEKKVTLGGISLSTRPR